MASTSELHIKAAKVLKLQDRSVIPTVVYYLNKKPIIGFDALDQCASLELLNEDFKVDLGKGDPSVLIRRTTRVGQGVKRSPLGLTKDFVDTALQGIISRISVLGLKHPTRVLIAEPLSLSEKDVATDSWLSNYRKSLQQILYGKFEEIDFLPEPFAVFQYYRYGARHALLAQRRKHVACVLDFGGGTFDASVIETTASGDISQAGRNSRPLSAKSVPVGGFFINQQIAEALLFEAIDRKVDRATVRKALNKFHEFRNFDPDDLPIVSAEVLNFVRNFKKTMQSVERAKIAICSTISNWSLAADLSGVAPYRVAVPRDPFQRDPTWIEARIDAARLRQIFESTVWKTRLLPAIRESISRAERDLNGREISIVLLSGGSSNIRWLRPLIRRDLGTELGEAEILDLSDDFQEIVARGLAIECARRYYTQGEGDFRAVTYNRLCLALRADDAELEIRRLRPVSSGLPHDYAEDGVLLPSASSLRGLVEQPLRWKIRLSKPPRRWLDYYFMRSSFDPENTDARQNLDHRVQTPAGSSFGGSIEVQLNVREDGTTVPSFIYGRGEQRDQTVVSGRPFALDMTFAGEEAAGETYLGFDFGTSTSSFSFVENADIQVYAERAESKTWLELNDLVSALPYPAAAPLAAYIAETDRRRMDELGRGTVEALLSLTAYLVYAEYCAKGKKGSSALFKGLAHRSAGPLWGFFKQTFERLAPDAWFSAPFAQLLREPWRSEIESAIDQIAQSKHDKEPVGLDYPRLINTIGNIVNQAFANRIFGFFEIVRPKPFSGGQFVGLFRNAKGPSQPFVELFEFSGCHAFSQEQVFCFDQTLKVGLCLSPLIFWGLQNDGSDYAQLDFYLFDNWAQKDQCFSYKAVERRRECRISEVGETSGVYHLLKQMKEDDPELPRYQDVELQARGVDGSDPRNRL